VKLFQKWYLSPRQFSEQCKQIEQRAKPSQERDQKFQDQKTVKDLIGEIKRQYEPSKAVEEESLESKSSSFFNEKTHVNRQRSIKKSLFRRSKDI